MNLFGIGLDGQYISDYSVAVRDAVFARDLSHISIVSPHLTEVQDLRATSGNFIHHLSGIAPADPMGPDIARLRNLNGFSEDMSARWCCEDLGVWNLGNMPLPYFVPPPLTRETLVHIVSGVKQVIETSVVPFALEVPYFSMVAGEVPLGEFFSEVHAATGCYVVLDVPHLYSYCLAKNEPPLEVLRSLPLDSIIEIHIAGGKISKLHPQRYVDTHSDPVLEEVHELLAMSVPLCRSLNAVTYEVGRDLPSEIFLKDSRRIESTLRALAFEPFGKC